MPRVSVAPDLKLYCLSRSDLAEYEDIFQDNMYEKYGVKLQDGDCLVDIGANIGLFTVWAKHKYPQSSVLAFEPIPETFSMLQKNVRSLGLDKVKLYNMGLSCESKQVSFSYYPRCSAHSTMYPENWDEMKGLWKKNLVASYDDVFRDDMLLRICPSFMRRWAVSALVDYFYKSKTCQCQLRTLSEIIAEENLEQIDLLKVDAENSELDVLAGIEQKHWPKIKQLVLESHSKEDHDRICTILDQRGYQVASEGNAIMERVGMEDLCHVIYAWRE